MSHRMTSIAETRELIPAMLDGGRWAFRGETVVEEPDVSWLDDDGLVAQVLDPSIIYVVYSYRIPIGWTDGERWTIHYARDSKTTKGHVNHLRRALSRLDGHHLALPGPRAYHQTGIVVRRIFRDAYPEQQSWYVNFDDERPDKYGDLWTHWSWEPKQRSTAPFKKNRRKEES